MGLLEYKPLLWLKSITTSTSHLFGIVELPTGHSLDPLPPELNIEGRRITFRYNALDHGGPSTDPNIIEFDEVLDKSIDYDPVMDDIMVEIIEETTGDRKGKGTVHQSEGDASGLG